VTEDRWRVPSLLAAPVGARALATAALIAGLAAGPLLVASLSDNAPDLAPVAIAETLDADWLEAGPSLAESYLSVLEAETGSAEPAESGDLGSRGDDSGELP
jgi:hypothetical protein